MTKSTKHTGVNNTATIGTSQVKQYGKSPFVAKKIQLAKETLQKFPVPEKYVK